MTCLPLPTTGANRRVVSSCDPGGRASQHSPIFSHEAISTATPVPVVPSLSSDHAPPAGECERDAGAESPEHQGECDRLSLLPLRWTMRMPSRARPPTGS